METRGGYDAQSTADRDAGTLAAAGSRDRGQPGAVHREHYAVLHPVPTRWLDNDDYGHVNNVVYSSYLDTAVNAQLMQRTGTDIRRLPAIGLVAETTCRFHAPVGFPDQLEVGLAIERLGRSSITYRLAVFRVGDLQAAATARYVHVYVERDTRRSTPIPEVIRAAMGPLVRELPPWD